MKTLKLPHAREKHSNEEPMLGVEQNIVQEMRRYREQASARFRGRLVFTQPPDLDVVRSLASTAPSQP